MRQWHATYLASLLECLCAREVSCLIGLAKSIKETYVKETYMKETYIKETYIKETYIKETYIKETYIKETYVECHKFSKRDPCRCMYSIKKKTHINRAVNVKKSCNGTQHIWHPHSIFHGSRPRPIHKN